MFKKDLLVLSLFILISCSTVEQVPMAIDLTPYERIGLISFSIKNPKSNLDEISTKRFLESISEFQKGVKFIELGTLDEVLGEINKKVLNQEAVKAIGEHFDVSSFFHGEINVSEIKRSSREIDFEKIRELRRLSFRATFNISMTAWLLSTKTGDTLWTDSVSKKKTLSYLSVPKSDVSYFDAEKQDETYKELTQEAAYELTKDFRPTKK
jgi:hypothetical protein